MHRRLMTMMMMNPHHPRTAVQNQCRTMTRINMLHLGPHKKRLSQRRKRAKGTKTSRFFQEEQSLDEDQSDLLKLDTIVQEIKLACLPEI